MESTEEVTRRAGISRRRFKDWRARGLIPGPVERPGRGHAKGRDALYPDGTAELCRAIAETMEEEDVYRLSDAALVLWLEGYPFTSYVQGRLVELLAEGLDEVESHRAEWDAKLGTGESLTSDHPVHRAKYGRPNMGFLNRVLSPDERSTIASIFLDLFAGVWPRGVLTSEGEREDEEASGPLRKAIDAVFEKLPDVLRRLVASEEWTSHARDVLEKANLDRLQTLVGEMSDEEMEEWRDELADSLERWDLPDQPRTEMIPSLMATSLMYRNSGIPIIRVTNYLLAHESSVGRQLGEWFRDHLLGAGPADQ